MNFPDDPFVKETVIKKASERRSSRHQKAWCAENLTLKDWIASHQSPWRRLCIRSCTWASPYWRQLGGVKHSAFPIRIFQAQDKHCCWVTWPVSDPFLVYSPLRRHRHPFRTTIHTSILTKKHYCVFISILHLLSLHKMPWSVYKSLPDPFRLPPSCRYNRSCTFPPTMVSISNF